MNTKLATDLIGKPGLFRVHGPLTEGDVIEARVKVLSPSGNYVFLQGAGWVETDKLSLLEELPGVAPKTGKAPSGAATTAATGAPNLELVKGPATTAETGTTAETK